MQRNPAFMGGLKNKKMRYVCHCELRNGIKTWGFRGRKAIHRAMRRADVW